MFRKLIFLWITLAIPVSGFSQNSKDEQLIEKQKLICLYQQIDDYLGKKIEPVMVILESDCPVPLCDGDDCDRLFLPSITGDPKSQENVTADDVQWVTKQQLQCFKQQFDNSIKDDPRSRIPIDFEKICQASFNGDQK